LDRNNIKITEIDMYAVEMQNPEVTVPAGAGDVPLANYKMIAALGVKRGDIERADLNAFVEKHGMPGFAPTQGHVPSGIPVIGHARNLMMKGEVKRAMIIGKGSLFLARMTNLFDGVSFVMEANPGTTKQAAGGIDEGEVRRLIAEAMRALAQSLSDAK
jgi:betaine reductase